MLTELILKPLEKDPPNLLGRAVMKGLESERPYIALPVFMTGVVVFIGAVLIDERIKEVGKKINEVQIFIANKVHRESSE